MHPKISDSAHVLFLLLWALVGSGFPTLGCSAPRGSVKAVGGGSAFRTQPWRGAESLGSGRAWVLRAGAGGQGAALPTRQPECARSCPRPVGRGWWWSPCWSAPTVRHPSSSRSAQPPLLSLNGQCPFFPVVICTRVYLHGDDSCCSRKGHTCIMWILSTKS